MTKPEKEYIITEDLFNRVERALRLSGKNELATEFGAIQNCFVPYTSAEKVLEGLIKTIELQRGNQDTNVRKGMSLAIDIIHAKKDAISQSVIGDE